MQNVGGWGGKVWITEVFQELQELYLFHLTNTYKFLRASLQHPRGAMTPHYIGLHPLTDEREGEAGLNSSRKKRRARRN